MGAFAMVFQDICGVFVDRERRWLHASVLAYFAVLPFNQFGISVPWVLPIFGTRVKYTELLLLVVGVLALIAFMRRRLRMIRAPMLYAFLTLNIIAQFTAWSTASDRSLLLQVGIAVARYSILIFLLVNVVRSEQLLRAVLVVVGITTAFIIAGVMVQFIAVHGAIQSDDAAAALGSRVPHVLAYAMIFFGTGLLYLFMRHRRTYLGYAIWALVLAGWANTVGIAYVKIGQLVALLLLVLLVFVLRGVRARATFALVVFSLVFVYRYHVIVVQKTISAWHARIAATALRMSQPTPLAVAMASDQRDVAMRRTTVTSIGIHGMSGFPIPWRAMRNTTLEIVWTPFAPVWEAYIAIAAPSQAQTGALASAPAIAAPSQAQTGALASAPVATPVANQMLPRHVAPSPHEAVIAPTIDEHSEQNRLRRTWSPALAGGSLDVRKRGIAVGWVIGRSFPWTGIGPGQLRDKSIFDRYAAVVQREAFEGSPYPWKRFFFRTDHIPAANPDKGIFNIFMNAWAETGAPGLIAIAGLIAVVLAMCCRALVRSWRIRNLSSVMFLFPMFLALLAYHQTVYLWVHPWFWSALALTYASARVALETSRSGSRNGRGA